MSIETTSTIEPQDISAAEDQCGRCHAKTVRLLDHPVPQKCGNCETLWFLDGGQEAKELRNLLGSLDRCANTGESSARVRLVVRGLNGQTK